jgi:hypothetical protein
VCRLASSLLGRCRTLTSVVTLSRGAFTNMKYRPLAVALKPSEFATMRQGMFTRTIQPRTGARILMTLRKITMTTRVEYQLSRDLYRSLGWPIFYRHADAPKALKLCANTVVWADDSVDEVALQRRAAAGLAHRIEVIARKLRFSSLVFIVTSALQPNTSVVRHRGLWSSPPLGSVPALERRWPEVIAECGTRIRIATLAAVPVSAMNWMLQLNESFESAVPVLLPDDLSLDDRTPIELLNAAFPPDGCRPTSDLDWPAFSSRVATYGGISVRRTNKYSDLRVSADFFGPDEVANQIESLVAEDDEVTRKRVR